MPRQRDIPDEFKETEQAIATAVGNRIRQRREELGMTQSELRRQVEMYGIYIAKTRMHRIEKGEAEPRASEIVALVAALKVTFDWLLCEDGETV